ncbi:MAG: hypothetical protein ACSLE2_08425, partial [Lysobacterales bacterium]
TALASLALLAGAPVVAQAAMVEMAESEMAGVNGQGLVTGFISGALGVADPFPIPGFTFVGENLGAASAVAAGDAFGDGVGATLGFGFLPFTGPISALAGFNGRILGNSADFGEGVADIAFYGPFSALDLASRIVSIPFNAVFGPVNRYVDGVTGRAQATVDGAAYAFTEVKGALITNAFAGASQAAANNDLNFTARVFGRISQAQAGLTTQRLEGLAGNYGY